MSSKHRCKSREILGGTKDFCPNSPKLARKSSKKSDLQKKQLFMPFWAPFSNQSMLGAISAHIFMKFTQIFRDFVKVFRDFAQISTYFPRILRDFARIFTKSKLLGVRFQFHPRLLHQCVKILSNVQSLSSNFQECTISCPHPKFAFCVFSLTFG